QIESLKEQNTKLLEEQQKILNSINEKTEGRIKEIYSQMKDTAIADVLTQMDAEDASKIMLSLESRKISGVLSKMDPAKASELTLLLKNMDNNKSN
ncbi:nucleosidase, partial [Campylobacter coli]|nr:nucleosidase [Campylobacter coli]